MWNLSEQSNKSQGAEKFEIFRTLIPLIIQIK